MAKRVVPVSFFLSMKDIKKVYGVEIKCRPAIKELIPIFFKFSQQPIMNFIIVRGKLEIFGRNCTKFYHGYCKYIIYYRQKSTVKKIVPLKRQTD